MRSRGCSTAIADKLCTRTCPLGARSQCKFTDKPQAFVNWNYKVWPSEGSASLCAGRMQVGVVSALWTTMFPLVASQTRGKATGRGPRPVLRLRPSGSGHAEGMGFVPMLLVLPLASVTARTTFRDDLAMTYHPRAGQPVRLLETETETERDDLTCQGPFVFARLHRIHKQPSNFNRKAPLLFVQCAETSTPLALHTLLSSTCLPCVRLPFVRSSICPT